MSLYKEIFKNNILFLFSFFGGAYAGIGLIIASYYIDNPQGDSFSFGILISKIISSPQSLFEAIVCFIAFVVIGILAAYGFVASSAYKKSIYQLKTALDTNKKKDEFTSMLLHHIRTPLSGIKWSLRDILKSGDALPSRELIQRIVEENERSLLAVDRLLTASQASFERISYNLEILPARDILELLENKADLFKPVAESKTVKFISNLQLSSSSFFKVDKDKIVMSFEVLVENAINYTQGKGVVSIEAQEKDNNLIISVSDTGIGIAKEDQIKIFSQFFRAKDAQKISSLGFGIGLYLAKNFVEHQGGKMWFVSEYGKGSTFYMSLPKFVEPTKEFLEKV